MSYFDNFFQYITFAVFGLGKTEIWNKFLHLIRFRASTYFYSYVFYFNEALYAKFLFLCAFYLIAYIATLINVRYYRSILFSSTRYSDITDEGMEYLGLNKVLNDARKFSGYFQKKVEFKVEEVKGRNAFNYDNLIVFEKGFIEEFNEDEKQRLQGVIAHELGHFANKDTTMHMIVKVCINAILLPMNFIALLCNLISLLPLGWIVGLLGTIGITIIRFITKIYEKIDDKILYLFGGRRAERRADYFAVDIGYGEGLLEEMEDYKSYKRTFVELFDVHPSAKTRCKYILKRIKSY